LHTPLNEIYDVLVATGDLLKRDSHGYLAQALDSMALASPLPRPILDFCYGNLWRMFERTKLEFQVDKEVGGADVIDGWREIMRPDGRAAYVRAFAPRLIHVVAGNTPEVAAMSIVMGALSKGVHLLKLPSNDLYTATAILRTMAAVAPGHPVVQSFSTAYWRGGDEKIESALFRPQYFDKVVAWGGEATIRSVGRYIGPGLELVGFDPKTSISMVGREAFAQQVDLHEVAAAAAHDVTLYNQSACVCSRFIFIEADDAQADRFCAELARELNVDRDIATAIGPKTPADLREQIDVLKLMTPDYRVWGGYDGQGVVIRSHEPVDFHPDGKVINVVITPSLAAAVCHANVATQTVGVYPSSRKKELRDALAGAGVQRIVELGATMRGCRGLPHDGFYPLHRLMRWVKEED